MEVDNEIFIFGNDTLSHHGIMGQSWGERNGPPYPLDKRTSKQIKKEAKEKKKAYKYEKKQEYKAKKYEERKKYKNEERKNKELQKKVKNRQYLSDEDIEKLTARLLKEKGLKDAYLANNSKAKSAEKGKEAVIDTVREVGKSTAKKVLSVALTGATLYGIARLVMNFDPDFAKAIVTGSGASAFNKQSGN